MEHPKATFLLIVLLAVFCFALVGNGMWFESIHGSGGPKGETLHVTDHLQPLW